MGTLEPIALSPRDAAQFLSISKRSLSRLIARRKIIARKDGVRTLVDMASLKAYYEALPLNVLYRYIFSKDFHVALHVDFVWYRPLLPGWVQNGSRAAYHCLDGSPALLCETFRPADEVFVLNPNEAVTFGKQGYIDRFGYGFLLVSRHAH